MQKKFFALSLGVILVLSLVIAGCGGGNPGGTPPPFSIAESLVTATTTSPLTFPYGDDSSTFTVNYSYCIAKYEVTYQLWKEVYDWAQPHGYTFTTGSGKPGGGYDITNSTEVFFNTGHDSDPVTCVNWYDAVVWCNALTEYYNAKKGTILDCVYKDAASNVIKNSTDSIIKTYLNSLAGGGFKPSAKGFRLPTSKEWELAARYKDGTTWTHFNYASGATGAYTDSTATQAVAWYQNDNSKVSSNPDIYSTHPVGKKNHNALGLYDMSGNVSELCFEIITGMGNMTSVHGGSFYHTDSLMGVGTSLTSPPEVGGMNIGFRPVRTQ